MLATSVATNLIVLAISATRSFSRAKKSGSRFIQALYSRVFQLWKECELWESREVCGKQSCPHSRNLPVSSDLRVAPFMVHKYFRAARGGWNRNKCCAGLNSTRSRTRSCPSTLKQTQIRPARHLIAVRTCAPRLADRVRGQESLEEASQIVGGQQERKQKPD